MRKISHSLINGRAGAGTGGQGLKVEWDSTNDGELHWLDVDESSLEYVAPFHFHNATNYGFTSGGLSSNVIDKFSLSSDANATDHADLNSTRKNVGGCGGSSTTHGYVYGGYKEPSPSHTYIDKFSFTSTSNATEIGDITLGRWGYAAQSSSDYGYCSGGRVGTGDTYTNVIDKTSFSVDGDSTDVGDLSQSRGNGLGGHSSETYGYTSGGFTPSYTNTIDKFTFSSDANATDVGDLTVARRDCAGQSSSTHGYTSGGHPGGSDTNVIDKFTFASDSNATDVGDLTIAKDGAAGQSSSTYGYSSGGNTSSQTNVIEKFSFTSDGNATDVGDLTRTVHGCSGTQY